MPRELVDLSRLDLTKPVLTEAEVRAVLPHDHEFRLVDAICFLDPDESIAIGYKDWDANPWWAKGHIPGRPIMPGVLLIEGAAQVATVLMKRKRDGWDPERFIGMGGVDNARFRNAVIPPARVWFVSKCDKQSRKIARFSCQAFNGQELAMEMELVGVLL
jgi:3-hydroxyacyl-[acyl-carrier-protein] dehydratase